MREEIYLSEKCLAKRWRLSPKTLQRWRWLKTGPCYIKIGGRIRYGIDAITDFENSHKYTSSKIMEVAYV